MGIWKKFKSRFTKLRRIFSWIFSLLTQIPALLRWLADQWLGDKAVRLLNSFINSLPFFLSGLWLWIQNNQILALLIVIVVILLIMIISDSIYVLKHENGKIEIEPKTAYYGTEGKYHHCVYFKIINNSKFDIRDCFLKLKRARVKLGELGEHWADAIEFVDPNTDEFSWPNFNKNEEKFIRAGDSARVNIFFSNEKEILFTFENEGKELDGILGGDYFLEIEFNGKINGKPLDSKKINGFLYHVFDIKYFENEPPYRYEKLFFEEGMLDEEDVEKK